MKRLLLLCALMFLSRLATAAQDLLPRPPELEPDVQFWLRVYTQVSTNEGLIHDQHRLSVVYETLHFDADTPSPERARKVDTERERFEDILGRLAHGAEPRDDEERRVRALWGDDATPAQLEAAASDVRFQLGQSDRFRAGLVRAGAWETHIGEVLANLGLPAEIAALPHVESSFDPYAYSKVGAAGLWQFMRSTGRRFLRIDAAVDERLDPYRETEAAAQLLSYNYRLLGSWPLAITAYNHGAEGMRRARELLGTDDIVRIVREYHSPTFGFASRNFYVSFLAALTIAQNPEKYFGGLAREQRRRIQRAEDARDRQPRHAGACARCRSRDSAQPQSGTAAGRVERAALGAGRLCAATAGGRVQVDLGTAGAAPECLAGRHGRPDQLPAERSRRHGCRHCGHGERCRRQRPSHGCSQRAGDDRCCHGGCARIFADGRGHQRSGRRIRAARPVRCGRRDAVGRDGTGSERRLAGCRFRRPR